MKKIRNILFILVICLTLISCMKKGKIILPKHNELNRIDIAEITVKRNENQENEHTKNLISSIKNFENIDKFIKTFDTTNKIVSSSMNETPVNVSKYYKIEFYHKIAKYSSSVAYIYKRNGKYYFEQPYEKIFKMNKDVFENLINFKE